MPASSEKQRRAAGAALSAKRGKTDPSKLKGASLEMYKSMSEKELEEYASKPTEKEASCKKHKKKKKKKSQEKKAKYFRSVGV